MMELGIVKKVMAFLQLDEAGKVSIFFEKQVKAAEKAIRDLNRNKVTLENAHKDELEDFHGKLQDAQENLEQAYKNVTLADIVNNAAIAKFEDIYWERIADAKEAITDLEDSMERKIEIYEKEIEEIDEQIEAYQDRIDALRAE